MDILETFQTRIQQMIDKFNLNVNISGVAEMVTEKKQHIFSASMIVGCEGSIPYPSEEGVANCKVIFQRIRCDGFRLKTLQYLRALLKDEKLLRWQVQYVVEDVGEPILA